MNQILVIDRLPGMREVIGNLVRSKGGEPILTKTVDQAIQILQDQTREGIKLAGVITAPSGTGAEVHQLWRQHLKPAGIPHGPHHHATRKSYVPNGRR